MPTLRLVFKALSMDERAKILWPTEFGSKTRAAIRKMANASLEAMVKDKLYPTSAKQALALTVLGSDAVWDPTRPLLLQE